jgi:hypothetical protein
LNSFIKKWTAFAPHIHSVPETLAAVACSSAISITKGVSIPRKALVELWVKAGYSTLKKLAFGAPQIGHFSGADPSTVFPQTLQTQ